MGGDENDNDHNETMTTKNTDTDGGAGEGQRPNGTGTDGGLSAAEMHERFAELSGRDLDPLAAIEDDFKKYEAEGVDPFEWYLQTRREKGRDAKTIGKYGQTYREWSEHMAEPEPKGGGGRHPACPAERHVRAFIDRELYDRGNAVTTAKSKLSHLNFAYKKFQDKGGFPTPKDVNPFETVREEYSWPDESEKEKHDITKEDFRRKFAEVTHIRDRAIILCGPKLGLRASEIRNMQLQDLALEDGDLRDHFPDLGTHPRLAEVGADNAIIIPPHDERDGDDTSGNKSKNPRILPLDEEMRATLIRWLLVRPDDGEPWVFLSKKSNRRLRDENVPNDVWQEYFWPEYAETEYREPVRSHYGRHWFTTYWRKKVRLPEADVDYMRGDNPKEEKTIDIYIHTHYSDIEPVYREHVPRLLPRA